MEEGFYINTYKSEARPWVVKAIAHERRRKTIKSKIALDIGCGVGMDSEALTKAGFLVYAIDPRRAAFKFLTKRFKAQKLPIPVQIISGIEKAKILKGRQFDLVNASYSIPFINRSRFRPTWRRIVSMVQPGGLISGNFFGDRDSWAERGDLLFHTKAEAKALLKGFTILHFKEWEHDAMPAVGELKHWHMFSFVARRKK